MAEVGVAKVVILVPARGLGRRRAMVARKGKGGAMTAATGAIKMSAEPSLIP